MPAQSPPIRVRLIDIARRAGVSAAVVSAVLREVPGGSTTRVGEKTAQRVRKVAQQMGYRPNAAAQQLRGRKSDLLGVLIGAESTAANFSRLAAIEHASYARSYRLMIGQFHADVGTTRSYLLDFLSRGIDTLICFHNPAPRYDDPLLALFAQFRSVVFQTHRPLEQACCVDVDRADGVRQAVSHLWQRGRRRIALLLNDHPDNDPLMGDRHVGWTQGLEHMGASPQQDLIWHGNGTFPPTPALLDQAASKLLSARADAVVASNDVWAIHLIKSLRRRGAQVPGDVAVVGFDNLDAAALFDPALTTIDQNNAEFAAAAVELGLRALDNGPLPPEQRLVTVRPRLVERESS